MKEMFLNTNKKDFFALKPIQIKNLKIDYPVFLAPMAGVTDKPFRILCKRMQCGLVYSEMISVKGLFHNNARTFQMIEVNESERPVAVQLFGSDIHCIKEAAQLLESKGVDLIDFNMGCPTAKIVKNGEGAWLMRDTEKAFAILNALTKTVKVPVTLKIRLGWDKDELNALEIAKVAENAGIAAITVHGRTAKQFYTGKADWKPIKIVKEKVNIPVVANGDICTPQDAVRAFQETNCDAVMIGRAAQGNPWIFRDIKHYFKTGDLLPLPSSKERQELLLEHLQMLIEHKGHDVAIREMRCHASWYTKGLRNATYLRQQFNRACCKEDFVWEEELKGL